MSAQAIAALSRANEIRTARAALKRRIANREFSRAEVIELLIDPPDEIRTMRVATLLVALPGFGKSKVTRLMKRAGAPALSTIGDGDMERLGRYLMAWPGVPSDD